MTKKEAFNNHKSSQSQKTGISVVCVLCIFGIVLALLSNLGCPCSGKVLSPLQKSFFGIPIVQIGILGYIALGTTSVLQLWKYIFFFIHGALTFGSVLFAAILAYRSFTLSYFCPFCLFCWLINCAMFQMFLYEYGTLRQRVLDFYDPLS